MSSRGTSIRRKIVGLLLLPLLSLTTIWAVAAVFTGREAQRLFEVGPFLEKVAHPVEDVVQGLQEERRQSLVFLADPRNAATHSRLRQLEQETDRRAEALRRNIRSDDSVASALSRLGPRVDSVLESLDSLEGLRHRVEEGTIARSAAFVAYNDVIDPCYTLLTSQSDGVMDDPRIADEGRALIGIARAREALSREDAMFASSSVAGRMGKHDLRSFTDRIADRELHYGMSLPLLRAEERALFEAFWSGPESDDLRAIEERITAAGPEGAVDAVSAEHWRATADDALERLDAMASTATERFEDRLAPVTREGLTIVLVIAGVGFLSVVLSLVVSIRIGRGLVRDLTRLRKEASEASDARLPSVLQRLAVGEQVDVETEAPRLDYPRDEMGQVGQALNNLQRAAVEAAVKQADVRRGISEVFVNLARRSQVLLHRQLALLDTMERRTEDPDELADLFKLDHLTTRMRRHAEGLVILSGAVPSRQWRKPVQLMDVVRAAVAEVEDYERIEVRRLPKLAVNGPAVADLTHLVAELLENATVFSPPHTAVQVLGERVANGFTLEIHDRGLGMAPQTLLDVNLRLAETPEFELSDTDRLGLFVVGRLARRQGVRVSLQPSPYGGTTAVVFIPANLLTEEAEGGGGEDRGESEQPERRPPGSGYRASTGTPAAITGRAARRTTPVLDGPVELEGPLDDLDGDDSEQGTILRTLTGANTRPRPAGGPVRGYSGEQHQHSSDDLEPARSGGDPVPLPRRQAPVLISDHGRMVEPDGRRTRGAQDEDGGGPESGAGRTPGTGLPRRVRQASLAPQLKPAEPFRPAEPDEETATTERDRDAEEVRSRMASLQRGWERGRADGDESAGDTGDISSATTTEGEDGR
ncbi:sensor histidine kinase [Streptomyces sp. TP-A0874]|uniref:sensor histidine kinase n=1 Tax=Streptomyces sp. TP-A0874 TaxID=549819 RepID=UPI0008531EA5|nr:nitrate- and nitrite sensing domain-containing protein [Streptomyces sp. TP-A0874]